MFEGFESVTGIRPAVVIAGIGGGIVAAIIDKGPLWERVISVFVGALCAIYFTPLGKELVLFFMNIAEPDKIQNGVAFFIGVTAMVLVRGIIDSTRSFFHGLQRRFSGKNGGKQ